MAALVPTIADARGVERRISYRFTRSALVGELGVDRYERICERLDPNWLQGQWVRTWRRRLGIVLGFGMLVFVLVTVRLPWWLGFVILLPTLADLVLEARSWGLPPAVSALLIRDAMIAEGRCPACAYSLNPDRLENGLYMICSECGAAWFPPLPPDPPRVA